MSKIDPGTIKGVVYDQDATVETEYITSFVKSRQVSVADIVAAHSNSVRLMVGGDGTVEDKRGEVVGTGELMGWSNSIQNSTPSGRTSRPQSAPAIRKSASTNVIPQKRA